MYDVMLSHNGANGPESNATRVSSSLLGGGTGGAKLLFTIAGLFYFINFDIFTNRKNCMD